MTPNTTADVDVLSAHLVAIGSRASALPTRPWSEVLTIGDLSIRAAEQAPDREAFVTPDERVTYRELSSGARTVARALRRLGVSPGDNVGILAPNSIEFLEGFFGAAFIGAVVVPLNIRYQSPELAYIAQHAQLSAILTTDRVDHHVDLAAVAQAALDSFSEAGTAPSTPNRPTVMLLRGADKAGCLDREHLEGLATEVSDEEVERLRSAVRIRDVGLILYTSGTTAHPKGCVLSHEAFTRGPASRAIHRFVTGAAAERYWIPGPFFHVGGLSPCVGCIAAAGTVLTDVHVDGSRALRLLEQEQPTSAWPWFPAITSAVLDHPEFEPARI